VIKIPQAAVQLTFSRPTARDWARLAYNGAETAWFDLDRISFPLTIRSVMPGDRLTPYGLQGSQKIKKLFIDRKIPFAKRCQIPLVLSGDTIIWVAGIRRSDVAPISDATNQTLAIRMQPLTAGGQTRGPIAEGFS
jgi:tRNA(Ile)-lysidine synthase